MDRSVGVLVIVVGLVVVLIGVLLWSGALSWFGRLPGDIRYETESGRVLIPVTSSIVASIVLTIVVNVLWRWLR